MRIRFLAPKRWRFLVGPCGEGFARSHEEALSSTESAWCVASIHHAIKHIKITQRCDESSCQILKVVFNRMDIDIDSYNDNTPRLEDGNHSPRGKKKTGNFKFPVWELSWVPAPHVAGSSGILYSKPAAQELPCLGFLRRTLSVPARQSMGKLQRRNFHVLGSCAACCRFLRGSL